MTVLLAIGTGKGLFLARSEDDRKSWQLSGPHHPSGPHPESATPATTPAAQD